jgi:hypothetical protein
VDCNKNLLKSLRDESKAGKTGEDNLKTTKRVFAAYESDQSGQTTGLG